MAGTNPAAQAVANYLTWINDRDQLMDADRIAELEEAYDQATDPIERLKAYSELENARDLPEERFLAPFLEHAVAWATENKASASSFLAAGVPKRVLAEAGFKVTTTSSGTRVTTDEIEEIVRANNLDLFTRPSLQKLTGASPATVASAVSRMVEKGLIVESDKDDPEHSGRGVMATVYEVANL